MLIGLKTPVKHNISFHHHNKAKKGALKTKKGTVREVDLCKCTQLMIKQGINLFLGLKMGTFTNLEHPYPITPRYKVI